MYKKYIKQIIDTIIATILFIILLPLMIMVLIITFIDLGTPLHNTLRYREGKNKKPYIVYKIRTKKLGMEYITDGTEYTKISYISDRLRINEIPQLINVIKGDMALVGPRPFIPGDILPKNKIPIERYLVKPGLTGLAQVNGGRSLTHKQKLEYDIIYYNNIGFLYDLKIILKTPKSLLSKNNFKEKSRQKL